MNKYTERATKLLETFTLINGIGDGKQTACVMSLAALVAEREFNDSPPCVCPILRSALIKLNDNMPDNETRKRHLGPLVADILGSKSTPEVELKRAQVATDWAIRQFAPYALETAATALQKAGLKEHADSLREHAKTLRDSAASAAYSAASAASAAYSAASADSAASAASAAYSAASYSAASYSAVYSAAYSTAAACAACAACAAACAAADSAAASVEVWEMAVNMVKAMLKVTA